MALPSTLPIYKAAACVINIQLAAWDGCKGSRGVGTAMHSIPPWDLGSFAENPPRVKWEQQALKDTPDHTNRWGYTP